MRLYFCWTEEQLEQLTALWDTTSRTCGRATVCRYAIRSSTAATAPDRPVSRSGVQGALGRKQKPQCVHISNIHADLLPTDVYSGMYARVTVNFFPYDASGTRGVGFGLGAVSVR